MGLERVQEKMVGALEDGAFGTGVGEDGGFGTGAGSGSGSNTSAGEGYLSGASVGSGNESGTYAGVSGTGTKSGDWSGRRESLCILFEAYLSPASFP